LDRAWATTEQKYRIAICDLAVQDDAVVNAHSRNKTLIGGRHGTVFRNAFLVQLPVTADRIVNVQALERGYNSSDPEITLDDVVIDQYRCR
jgi:hypothetical protein